ncbi:unnamed protein product [Colias eurytheme]|nr:unnamed protein product [Colias eurytheme]
MAYLQILFCFCFIGACYAKSEADIKAWFLEKAMECSGEHSVTSHEVNMMKDHKIPSSDNAKCLLACVFKKVGWIDDKGMFDDESAYQLSLKEFSDDKDKIKNARKLYDLCKKVNDETVNDAEKGCERASLLATCLINNAAQNGFLLQ